MTRPLAVLVGPIAGPTPEAIRENCWRVAMDLSGIVWRMGFQYTYVHWWAWQVIRDDGGMESPELRQAGIKRSLQLVDDVAKRPGSILCSIMTPDGLGWSSGTTLDVQRWRQWHGPQRQIHKTWAEWLEVRNGCPRPWKAGDRVRVVWESFPTEVRTLSQQSADDLNNGENPYYPWRVLRFERVEEDKTDG